MRQQSFGHVPNSSPAKLTAERNRTRRILNLAADDPMGEARAASFVHGLQAAGWADGRNVRIDTRWVAADPGNYRKYARNEPRAPSSRRNARTAAILSDYLAGC
jgi:hypothetical protein